MSSENKLSTDRIPRMPVRVSSISKWAYSIFLLLVILRVKGVAYEFKWVRQRYASQKLLVL